MIHSNDHIAHDKETVTIIGAGPAGLTAAYRLAKTGRFKPIIIEKENFVGGISRTVIHHGNRMDIGGHRFFTKNMEVRALWEELMPTQGAPAMDDILLGRDVPLSEGGPDPEVTDKVFLIRNRVSRILYMRRFFAYPLSLGIQTIKDLGLANTFFAGVDYMVSAVFKRKESTLEDFMVNRFGKRLYNMFFKDYTHKVWGRWPSEISADWGAQRIRGLSLIKAILHMFHKGNETSLIEQFTYPKKGPGQYWETMAEAVISMGGEIILNTSVIGVKGTWAPTTPTSTKAMDGSEDHLRHIDGIMIRTGTETRLLDVEHLFSSMPIKDLVSAMGFESDKTLASRAEVPDHINRIAEGLPYRDFITVGLLVDRLAIKNTTSLKTHRDLVPDCWIYVQEPDVLMGRVQVFNNWSPYLVADYENSVWIGLEYFCQEGDALWVMDDAAFIRLAEEEAVRIGLIGENAVRDSVRIRVEKAYPAYFGTYEEMDDLKYWLDGFDNLYCIGRNGQHRYNNMDHSMLTAMEAVRALERGGMGKANLWEVNADAEYHETRR